jgi:hypothetical protein
MSSGADGDAQRGTRRDVQLVVRWVWQFEAARRVKRSGRSAEAETSHGRKLDAQKGAKLRDAAQPMLSIKVHTHRLLCVCCSWLRSGWCLLAAAAGARRDAQSCRLASSCVAVVAVG